MDIRRAKPEKFIQSYICQCFQPHNYCICSNKLINIESFIESVEHMVEAITEVMTICEIPESIAKQSKEIVFYYFLNFKEKRHRIDTVPRKHLYRLDLMNDLACKCGMTFTQAQISYSIIKRAFRAFYYGTDEGGVPNPLLKPQLRHSPACIWYNAARRTAQVMASYIGMFPIVQQNIELQIRQIYRKVYEYIKKHAPKVDAEHECTCEKCYKRTMIETLHATRSLAKLSVMDKYAEIYSKENKRLTTENYWSIETSKRLTNITNEIEEDQCNCGNLRKRKDEYAVPLLAESTNTGYSQGPFICCWYPVTEESDEEDNIDVDVQFPEEVPCPPNDDNIEESEYSPCSSCECTCESCTCSSERSCATTDTPSTIEIIEEEDTSSKKFNNLDINEATPYSCCYERKYNLKPSQLKTLKKPKQISPRRIKKSKFRLWSQQYSKEPTNITLNVNDAEYVDEKNSDSVKQRTSNIGQVADFNPKVSQSAKQKVQKANATTNNTQEAVSSILKDIFM